ncbi:MAG: hypothetical protein CVT82_07920 [Alphaproteobacteria bacterium HGW-Alphaproteobacteria-4]|nr:MAG: hypothetical protein CVT82_07920 [Alphaproteobacteria bacterium HGW-Alphaproteobacteria-4]
MKRNFYKSTTALVMTLSLFQPVVAMAQEPVTIECTPQLITDGVPCLDPLTKLLVAPQADLKKDNKPDKADKAPRPLAAEEAQAAAAAAEAEKAAAKALADEAKARRSRSRARKSRRR